MINIIHMPILFLMNSTIILYGVKVNNIMTGIEISDGACDEIKEA